MAAADANKNSFALWVNGHPVRGMFVAQQGLGAADHSGRGRITLGGAGERQHGAEPGRDEHQIVFRINGHSVRLPDFRLGTLQNPDRRNVSVGFPGIHEHGAFPGGHKHLVMYCIHGDIVGIAQQRVRALNNANGLFLAAGPAAEE